MSGRDTIVKTFEARPAGRVTRHVCSNVHITVDSATRAHGVSRVVLFAGPTEPAAHPQFGYKADARQLIGEFDDEFSRPLKAGASPPAAAASSSTPDRIHLAHSCERVLRLMTHPCISSDFQQAHLSLSHARNSRLHASRLRMRALAPLSNCYYNQMPIWDPKSVCAISSCMASTSSAPRRSGVSSPSLSKIFARNTLNGAGSPTAYCVARSLSWSTPIATKTIDTFRSAEPMPMKRFRILKRPAGHASEAIDPDNPPWTDKMLGATAFPPRARATEDAYQGVYDSAARS